MTQESRLVIRVDSKLSETQVKDLDKALMLLERTGLSVTRTAKTTSAEITALGRESDTATRSIDRATAVWSKFNSVVALAGVGLSAVSAINMYKSVAANVESLRLFSQQIGITTEQLSSLRYAADDMAGVSSRTLDPALRRMTRRIQEAANESGPAANALKMLRLEAKALSELDVESQLYAVADALKDLPNHADKLRATMAIFDTEGMPLVNMLNQGADAIRAAQIEAEQLNQTISQVDADRVGRLNSEFSKLSARLDGIKTQSMLGFLPVVEDLNTGLNVLADNFDAITAVVGGAGLIALSRYTGGLIETRVETIKSTLGKRNAVRAELDLARAQQLQTAETLRQTLALNAQNVTRVQTQAAIQADIAARARLTAAEAAMTAQVTASTAAMGLARGALGLVGGPFGALTLAVTAGAAAWYKHEQRVRENRNAFESLKGPLDELIAKYEKMDGLQKQGFINEAKRGLDQALKDEKKLWDDLGESIVSSTQLYSSAFDEKTQALLEFRGELNLAKESGSGLADIIQQMSESEWLSYEDKARVQSIAAELRTLQLEISGNEEKISKLEAGFKGFGEQAGGLKAVAGEVKGLLESDFTKLINGLTQTLDVIGMSAQQAAEYKARLEGANEQQAKLAGVLAGMADAAQQVEKATQEKDAKALKGAQALLDKLVEQEVQIRMNMARAAEYAALVALGIEATIAAQGADTAAELEGLRAQEEIVARIKAITGNITANTVPSLKKTGNAAKQLSNEIDNLIGSLFPAIKAEQDWVKQQKLLDEALKKGKLTKEQHAKGLVKIREQYELIAFAVPEHVKALQDEAKSIKASIPSLRQRVETFGLSASAISRSAEAETRARIATLNNIKAVEVAKSASKEYVKQIEQEIDALKELLIQQEHQTGLFDKGERQEAEQKYYQDMADTAKRAHEEIERSLTDALMRGFESGKDFGRNFIDTLKNMFGSLVLRPIIQPIAAGAAGMITGGFSSAANAQGAGGFLGSLSSFSPFTGFAGSSAGLVQSVGGSLASINGSLGDFGANLIMNADKIGSALDMAGAGIAYGASIYQMTQGKWGAGLGGAAGQFLGGPIGSFIGSQIGGMLDKAFKGETRYGGGFWQDAATGQTYFGGGPSGGYGGQKMLSTMGQVLAGFSDSVTGLFDALGVSAELVRTTASFESSEKGRGGTSSGGTLVIDGQTLHFGSVNQDGGVVKGKGYGGTSGSAEEMFEAMTKDMVYSTLEAWQLVADKMPPMLSDMLSGIDVRGLAVDQAEALAAEMHQIVGSVNALSMALNQLPMTNLKELAFEAKAGLNELFGGVDQAVAGLGMYYQEFYTEAERAAHTTQLLTAEFGRLGYELPASRDALRELVDGVDLSTREGQELYVQLIQMAPAFASVTEAVEGLGETLTDVSELMRLLSTLPFNHLRSMGEEAVRVLADLSGGVDVFTRNLSGYYQGFFSEHERFVMASGQLASELSGLGVSLPATADGFRSMMDSIDLTTQAGQELFTALLRTADQAASYYRYVEREQQSALADLAKQVQDAQQKELDAIKAAQKERLDALRAQQADELAQLKDQQSVRATEMRKSHEKQVKAVRTSYDNQVRSIRDAMSAVNDKLRELSSLSRGVKSSLDSLRGFSDLAVDLHRTASKGLVEDAIRLASSGHSLAGMAGLEDAVSAVGRLEASNFSSLFEYERERAESVQALKQLSSLTDGQVSVQDMQLAAMEKQLTGLEEWRTQQLDLLSHLSEVEQEKLQSLFEQEREQLKQQSDLQLSLMQKQHEEEQASFLAQVDLWHVQEQERLSKEIEQFHHLHSLQEAANDIFESEGLKQRAALQSVQNAIDASAGRISSAVSNMRVSVSLGGENLPAFADGGYYRGGLALVGEKGPEIINFSRPGMVYTAAQSQNLMASGNNQALIEEIRRLRAEVAQLRADQQQSNMQLVKNTLRTSMHTEPLRQSDSDDIIVVY